MHAVEATSPRDRKSRRGLLPPWLLVMLVLCAGIALAWLDTRPRWDDTGITVFGVLVVAAIGAAAGLRPWLSAVLVFGPLVAAELSSGMAVLAAIPVALVGGLAGAFGRGRVVKD